MIRLHKLGRTPQPFHLNPDLILTVEANPDTVVVLTTGSRLVVVETPEQVAEFVRTWRASVLDAMTRVPRRSQTLALVRGTAGDGAIVALNAEHARQESELPTKGTRS
jgi:flagellar protein FlbD